MLKSFKCLAFLSAIATLTFSNAFANFIVVTPQQIVAHEEGLFVNVENSLIAVESLHKANNGYFVAVPTPKADICPVCGHEGYTQGRFCPWCNFPDDGAVNLNVSSY